jgi:hypothetical protein
MGLAESSKSEKKQFYITNSPVCNIHGVKTSDFKILKTVGEPLFGPNLSYKGTISQTFFFEGLSL